MVSAKQGAVTELPSAAICRVCSDYDASRMIQERREAKKEGSEHPERRTWSVEHGFTGTFGTSNKYRMMDTYISAWMDTDR
jgi:hypothetical protein